MEFIDLQEKNPKELKTYEVLITNPEGLERKAKANWTESGFELINDSLHSDNYIVGYFE